MESREIIKKLQKDGWLEVRTTGSHHHFRHPTKKGIVTVPHPRKDIMTGTFNSIKKTSGLEIARLPKGKGEYYEKKLLRIYT